MRAITGTVISSEPCTLAEVHVMIKALCRSADSYLESSDCPTYLLALDNAIKEHHQFLRHFGLAQQQQVATGHHAHGYEAPLEGEEEIGDTKFYLDGPHDSVEEAEVAVAAEVKKSKKKKEEEPRDDNAEAGVPSHAPASPEILFEQRKKKNKEKHFSKELLSIVKQEPDLVVEDGGSERKKKKKKDKHPDQELARDVKQEPGLVVEQEVVSEKKKAKKKREKDLSDGEKTKKHSREVGDSKGVKEEEDKMAIDSDLNSEKKKKKKRGRGDGDDDVQEQGEHKKKKRKESRD